MSIEYQEREPVQVTKPEPKINTEEVITMSDSKTFFENPLGAGAGLSAGVGGLIGAALGGNGGLLGGNREPAVTPDQLGNAINNLQSNINTEALQGRLSDIQSQISNSASGSTAVIAGAISGVKDALHHADTHNQLALCNLGHNVTAGFALTNANILAQGAASRELALQQALDAERARATELRIALSETKNQAGHTATQVLLNQVITAK